MKKLTLLLVCITVVIAACATPPSDTVTSDTKIATKTPKLKPTKVPESKLEVDESKLQGLTIAVWYPWFGLEADFFETLVSEFNAENEWGIIVTPVGQTNFGYLYENVTTSIPTPNRPNLVIALPEHTSAWHAEGMVADLDPYQSDPKYGVQAAEFPLVFWNQDVTGDVRIAFPAQRTARFLLWNESWAGELGFKSPPASTADFQEQVCAAHQSMLTDQAPENDGQGGWIVDTEPMTAYAWLLAFEGFVLESNDYRFLTPNNIAAFKYVKSLAEMSCAWQINSDGSTLDSFANRQALVITASLEDLPEQSRAFARAGNSDEWHAIPFPGGGAMPVYGSSYVMLKASPQAQLAAWLFITWLISPEQDARWVETTHLFPMRNSSEELLAEYKASHPQWFEVVELLTHGEVQPELASWRLVKIMLGDGFSHMFRANVPSGQVAAILAQMESTSRDLSK